MDHDHEHDGLFYHTEVLLFDEDFHGMILIRRTFKIIETNTAVHTIDFEQHLLFSQKSIDLTNGLLSLLLVELFNKICNVFIQNIIETRDVLIAEHFTPFKI